MTIPIHLVVLAEAGAVEVQGAGPLDGSRVVSFKVRNFEGYESPYFALAQPDLITLINALVASAQQVTDYEACLKSAEGA